MNKGSLRLIAELTSATDPTFGSSHDNTYRGLSDEGLAWFGKETAKITGLVTSAHGKDGPYAVTLQSVTTKNDGTVVDTGKHSFAGLPRHSFAGLPRQVLHQLNNEVLRVGHELAAIAKQKG